MTRNNGTNMHQSHLSTTVLGLTTLCASGALGLQQASAQFTSNNVSLYEHLNLSELGGASSGNDCWGYVSPSGREYALMGVSNALKVVEITIPSSPVIIGTVSHTSTLWGDIKTYQDYAYVVNDGGGGGMDIVDLSDVDNGNVTLVQRLTVAGLSTSHNVAIDDDSGYLYLCGANLGGGRLIAFSLADPENPVQVGVVSTGQGAYVHDAQIVTYTSGPNAGKQIAFCANGGTGLDIYDVTTKSSMPRLSRTTYPNLAYAHQCWLSADKQYLYLNDELDNVNETVILDVSDLSNPVQVGSSTTGLPAYDHNLYVHNGFIFEAEYRAGVRIFCVADPINPVQVGWFDTYPENDLGDFFGAWSCYPFFPSGTLIVSDIDRGLFILDPSAALTAGSIGFAYPQGQPELISPAGGTTMRVDLSGACGAVAAAGTGTLHYDAGAGFVSIPMDVVSGDSYDAVFPAVPCGTEIDWYVSAEDDGAVVFTDPTGAPASTYGALSAEAVIVDLQDNFEVDTGWVASNLGASSGDWQRGVPVDDSGWSYDPGADGDGSGQCYLTQNEIGNTDVDGGAVRLTSPLLDMTLTGTGIAYEYFLRLTDVNGGIDALVVEISSNGDAGPWIEIARHDSDGGLSWRHHDIFADSLAAAGVTATATMKVRYTANDSDPQSIVEAGLDGFELVRIDCAAGNPADLDNDGMVGVTDLLILLGAWGPCQDPCPPFCLGDLDNDCEIGVTDLLAVLGAWG